MYTSNGELSFSDYEKAEIETCLNCTKPVEECDGTCGFDNIPIKQSARNVKIKDTDTGIVYNSITEAARAMNRSIKTIHRASKSDTRRVAGHKLIRVR